MFKYLILALALQLPSLASAQTEAQTPSASFDTTKDTKAKAPVPKPQVSIETSIGLILIELYDQQAPVSAANFLAYVRSGFYNGTIFHRVIPGFVVQGGGFDKQYQRLATNPAIINESTSALKNKRGTLALARLPDPNSATSQFFINLQDNPSLDWHPNQPGYTVFGRVVSGMEVVDKLAQLPQGEHSGVFVNAPNAPVAIIKMTLVEDER